MYYEIIKTYICIDIRNDEDNNFEITMVDTAGYGDKLSDFEWSLMIKEYIKSKVLKLFII